MKISYNWLQTYFDEALPNPKDLADLINAHSFEIDSLEEVGKDHVLDVKILPDRAHYALCHRGIAREVKAISGQELKTENTEVGPTETRGDKVAVDIQAKDLCFRYMACRIDGVVINDSPEWIKERLTAIGSRTINNVVDATNYVMLDVGQPLHAFDADKIQGSIIIRRATMGEKIELLPETLNIEGKVVLKDRHLELNETDLVIADEKGPLAIAGVKGGRRAEISSSTKNIILESANFSPVSIRRTSTRLNVRNDSSKRFENEIIPELAEYAMKKVIALVSSLSTGASVGSLTDEKVKTTSPWQVNISQGFISQKLGIEIANKEIIEILQRMDCKVEEGDKNGGLIVTPPLDRLDLIIPEDFSDEIARIKGYDVVPSILPLLLDQSTPVSNVFYWSQKAKEILVVNQFSEALLYSLVAKGAFEIERPLASDKSSLRESIVPKMKEVLAMNSLNADLLGLECVRIFEIGKVFPASGEKTVLTIGMNQVKKKKGINSEAILTDVMVQVQNGFGIKSLPKAQIIKEGSFVIAEYDFDVMVKDLPSTQKFSDLKFQPLPKDKKYIPFSLYPFIVRDIAVFVPESVTAEEVWAEIQKGIESKEAMNILLKHSLFDVFKKDGKVSYAYRMIFQSKERTLTDQEVSGVMDAINGLLKGKGWEVR